MNLDFLLSLLTEISGSKTALGLNITHCLLSDVTHEAPKFLVRPRDVSTQAGNNVSLYCAVQGPGLDGNRPTITWLRQGSTINIEG